MSKYVSVTVGQMECGRKIANEKQLGRARFQQALDDGSFGRWVESLMVDPKAVTPPQGARIHTLRVKVKLDRPWQEAVNAAGPNTPNAYNVRKVGDLYVPTGTEEVLEDLILLNYSQGDGSWDSALAWAQTQGLKNTVPREVFAISEQYPKLHLELGLNPMYVVATIECSFEGYRRACFVWWCGSAREAYLGWFGSFGSSRAWFVFRK